MAAKEIRKAFFITWPLLLGMLMIMVGNGLQGTLLSLRANAEGFSMSTVGLVMSFYYLGFLVGCKIVPKMIETVGHVRVFAAMASLASATILVHGMFVEPVVWCAVRVLSGVSFAGLFIVTESWLGSISTPRLRGQIFGFYILVTYAGLFFGQFLLKLSPVSKIDLFILISVLVSIAMLPITLANKPAPFHEIPKTASLKKMFLTAPLGVIGVLFSGVCGSAFFSLFPVYLNKLEFSQGMIITYMNAYILGAGVVPMIVGKVSDYFPRRDFMLGVLLLACVESCYVMLTSKVTLVGIFLMGGSVLCLYSIAVTYINDYLEDEEVLSASARLIMLNSAGAVAGPLVLGGIMDWFGVETFFFSLFGMFLLALLFGLWRSVTTKGLTVDEQGDFITVPHHSTQRVTEISLEDAEIPQN